MTEAIAGRRTAPVANRSGYEQGLPRATEKLTLEERQVRVGDMIQRFRETVLAKFPNARGIPLTDSEGTTWDVQGTFSRQSGELYGLSMHSGYKPKAVDYSVSMYEDGEGKTSANGLVSDWSEKRRPMWYWLNENTAEVFDEIQAKLDELLPPSNPSVE